MLTHTFSCVCLTCKTPEDDSPGVTQVVSGRARSNLWFNSFKFRVLPAVPCHLRGAEGVVEILLRKRDEMALGNLGAKQRRLSSLSQSQTWSRSSSLQGSTQEHLTAILSFALLYAFPVAYREYFCPLSCSLPSHLFGHH